MHRKSIESNEWFGDLSYHFFNDEIFPQSLVPLSQYPTESKKGQHALPSLTIPCISVA